MITRCATGTFGNYACYSGDTATAWVAHYGASTATTSTADILSGGMGTGTYPFTNGCAVATLPLASSAGFTAGNMFTISTGTGSDFELLKILTIPNSTSLTACFDKHHFTASTVTTGGAVGHAIGMTADAVPAGTWPMLDGTNYSIYRLVHPIVASANIGGADTLVVYAPSGSGGSISVNTKGLALNSYVSGNQAGWSLTVSGGQLTAITPTTFVNIYVSNVNVGQITSILPLPSLTFSGGSCTTFPVAHTIYAAASHGIGLEAVIDNPGAGCGSGLTVSTQTTFPNPYSIYPMAWVRDVRQPNCPAAAPGANTNVNVQSDPNAVVLSSTCGYVLTAGAVPATSTDGFSLGDTVEQSWNANQYMHSELFFYRPSLSAGRFDGSGIFNIHFRGVGTGSPLSQLLNDEPSSTYYGTASNGWSASQGMRGTVAPEGYVVNGSSSVGLYLSVPPRGPAAYEDTGALMEVGCDDPSHPACNSHPSPYYIFREKLTGHGYSFDPVVNQIVGQGGTGLSFPVVTATSSVATPLITTGANVLALQQTGAGYGTTKINIRNDYAQGAEVEEDGFDFADWAFKTSTGNTAAVRHIHLAGALLNSGNTSTGETQMIDGSGSPWMGCGGAACTFVKPVTISGYGYLNGVMPSSGNHTGYLGTAGNFFDHSAIDHEEVGGNLILDFLASTPGMLKYVGGTTNNVAQAVPCTDYQGPIALTTTGTGAATFNCATGALNIPTPLGVATSEHSNSWYINSIPGSSTSGGFALNTPVGQVFYDVAGSTLRSVTARIGYNSDTNCATAPTIAILDFGTSATTAYGSATVLTTLTTTTIASGVVAGSTNVFSASGLSIPIAAGHYIGLGFSAGACSVDPPTFSVTTTHQ